MKNRSVKALFVAISTVLLASSRGQEAPLPSQPLAPPTGANPTPPPPVPLSSQLQDVVRLSNSNVSEDLILSYIQNSSAPFNLTADQVLYARDVGISEKVITAMINHRSPGVAAPSNLPNPTPPSTVVNPYGGPLPTVVSDSDTIDASAPEAVETPDNQVAADYFYQDLSPYGNWVPTPEYGLVWQPTVAVRDRQWRPYFQSGRWIMTDNGWYWQSDYTWGWAPFHYGRWRDYPGRGWVWTPAMNWGPAWVTWRYSQDYCGWAPLPPEAVFSERAGLVFHTRSVGLQFDFGFPVTTYTFIPTSHFNEQEPWRYRVGQAELPRVAAQTVVVTRFSRGPDRAVVNVGIDPVVITRVTRTEIKRATIRDLPAERAGDVRVDRLSRDHDATIIYRPPPVRPNDPNRQVSPGGRGRGVETPPARQDGRAGASRLNDVRNPTPAKPDAPAKTVVAPPAREKPAEPARPSTPSADRGRAGAPAPANPPGRGREGAPGDDSTRATPNPRPATAAPETAVGGPSAVIAPSRGASSEPAAAPAASGPPDRGSAPPAQRAPRGGASDLQSRGASRAAPARGDRSGDNRGGE